ncbi:MAG: hypothetical protein Q9187_007167, partial [Circinaria calcarea]
MDHLRIQRPNHGALEIKVADEEGPVGEVNDGGGEGFVERAGGIGEAFETGARAEGGGEGGAEGEEGVFGGVMIIDWKQRR